MTTFETPPRSRSSAPPRPRPTTRTTARPASGRTGAPVGHGHGRTAAPRTTPARQPQAPRRRTPPPAPPHAPRVGDPARRQAVLTLAVLVIMLVFVVRLVDVQIVSAAPLAKEALEQRLVTTQVTPARADIVDRNGTPLATSVDRWNVFVNQTKIAGWKRTEDGVILEQGPLDAAKILAPILGVSESELAAALSGDKTFQYIAKNITPETQALIKAERIAGIDFEPTSERLYPGGNIAGNIIGFMGGSADSTVDIGLGGVEKAYEDVLVGTPGSRTYEAGNYGTVIPTGVHSEEPAVAGQDVILTIDSDIQYFTEQALANWISQIGASGGTVVVTDSRTSEVLALVDSGAVNPADAGATPADARGSGAVEDVFEPGSTAKTITMAAALEEGVAEPGSQFVAPYEYTTANNQTFHDSHVHADEKLTLAGILVSSSNTGTIQVGQQLSEETRYDYMRAFGLGESTDVGLPHESAGILHPWEEWDGRTTYATMYGQGVSVTAIQTAQVYGIIANKGMKIAPTIVSGFRAEDGTITPRETAEPERVISEQTAAEIMSMLTEVTQDGGTGKAAAIDGYLVAGKTGTAQAPDANGQLTRIVASFVGIAPADDPRIVVSVILYDPQGEIWGGTVAAPLFKDVATFALQTLRVPPSTGQFTRYPTTWE